MHSGGPAGKRTSLRARLSLAVTGILAVAILVVSAIALVEQERQARRQLEGKAGSLVQFLARVSPLGILSLNFVELNNSVRQVVVTDEEAVYAAIQNEQGIPLVYFFESEHPVLTGRVRELIQTMEPLAAMEALRDSGSVIEVSAPITSGPRLIGTARLGLSLEGATRALRRQIVAIGLATLAIAGLSMLLLRLALRQVLLPVQALTAAAAAISEGNLEVALAGTERTDELGILARAFESMARQLRGLVSGLQQRVDDLRRTGDALRESEERFRTAFENASVGVCLVSTEGRLVRVNEALCRMFGYGREELERMTVQSIAHPDDLRLSPGFIEKANAGGTELASFDKRYLHKQGHVVWGHVSSALVRDPQGQPAYFITHVQDITERKNAEEEIRRLNEELGQRVEERTALFDAVNRELEAFAYSVSHDLRAPLRHIGGFLELLRERTAGSLDAQSLHFMETAVDSSRRLGTLMDDLLSFSRMGRTELVRSTVDVASLVREVLRALEPEIAGRSVVWRVGDLPPINADRQMLRLALTALLSNAVKFTRPRPQAEIEVGAFQPPGVAEIVLFVRDNGVGFDMRYADKLFKVFQRLHRAEDWEGTGIGLANVRRVVERHGGRVWAEGTPGKGASFFLAFPARVRAAPG